MMPSLIVMDTDIDTFSTVVSVCTFVVHVMRWLSFKDCFYNCVKAIVVLCVCSAMICLSDGDVYV